MGVRTEGLRCARGKNSFRGNVIKTRPFKNSKRPITVYLGCPMNNNIPNLGLLLA